MCVATGIAIGMAAASMTASVAQAKIQSNAAKKAAGLQSEAADKSLDFAKQQYQDQQARLQPYANAGTAALQNLQAHPFQPYTQAFVPPSAGGTPMGTMPLNRVMNPSFQTPQGMASQPTMGPMQGGPGPQQPGTRSPMWRPMPFVPGQTPSGSPMQPIPNAPGQMPPSGSFQQPMGQFGPPPQGPPPTGMTLRDLMQQRSQMQ